MSTGKGLVSKSYLTAIANAIRAKTGSTGTYMPSQMADAITGIQTGQPGQTISNDWTMVVNQSSHQIITATPKAVMTNLGSGKYRLTLDADTSITADSGYIAGDISKSVSNNILTISASAAKSNVVTPYYIVNGSTDYTDKTLTYNGVTYTLTPFDNGSRTLLSFTFVRDGDVSIVPKYNDTVTKASLNDGGALYNMIKNSTLTLTVVGDESQTCTIDGSNVQVYVYSALPMIYAPASSFNSTSTLKTIRTQYTGGKSVKVSFVPKQ